MDKIDHTNKVQKNRIETYLVIAIAMIDKIYKHWNVISNQ